MRALADSQTALPDSEWVQARIAHNLTRQPRLSGGQSSLELHAILTLTRAQLRAWRVQYLTTLEASSVKQNIVPFATFIREQMLVDWSKEPPRS